MSQRRILLFVFALLLPPMAASASTTEVIKFNSGPLLRQGDFDETRLTHDGHVVTSASFQSLASGLLGPALAMLPSPKGMLVATSGPGVLWRIKTGAKPEHITELPFPLATGIYPVGGDVVALLMGPKGGVTFVDVVKKKIIGSSSFSSMEALLDGVVIGDLLYVVGGGEEGALYSASLKSLLKDALKTAKAKTKEAGVVDLKPANAQKKEKVDLLWKRLVSVDEKHLRSIAVAKGGSKPTLLLGGGDEGVVYQWHNGQLRALFDGKTTEVTDLVTDRKGRIYASLVDAEGKWSEGGTQRDKGQRKGPPVRKVKSAEVVRIDSDGRVSILWQSKKNGAYSLALFQGKLFVGTGSKGRLLSLDPDGQHAPEFVAERNDHDELTQLLVHQKSLYATTAHGGGLLKLFSKSAAVGFFYSPVVDAKHNARFGAVHVEGRGKRTVFLRSGNTKKADETWSAFHKVDGGGKSNAPSARYAQIKVELTSGARLWGLSLAYLSQNRAPEISSVEVVSPGYRLTLTPEEIKSRSRSVTFTGKPFKKTKDNRDRLRPKHKERSGKQIRERGHQIVYAHVEDPEKDRLQFQWWMRQAGTKQPWKLLEEFDEAPFVSIATGRLEAGQYQVRVVVSDRGSNAAARALQDIANSPIFTVAFSAPRFTNASFQRTAKGKARLRFVVESEHRLVGLRCVSGNKPWQWIDPKDGMLDEKTETIDVVLALSKSQKHIRCEAVDEGDNRGELGLAL
ncbi:MAG: hypothetical protein GY822_21620 [Deltaproteobacteria bacterium]|nr:hypothetical protein [Deltaproteobacteria bacterium]